MFVPFISEPSTQRRKLWKRKGGGGRGGGGGGGGKGGSSSGGGRAGSTSVSSAGGSRAVAPFSSGGGKPVTITSGAFQGRTQGGGTRSSVYGSKTYGSGYPGAVGGRGTAGLGFPFIFWPLAFGGVGYGGYHYLSHDEYGRPDNETRPGGPQTVAIIPSANSGSNTTFRFLTDRDSIDAMKPILVERCGSFIQNSDNIATERFNGSSVTPPHAEEVVQYYRASTAALALDGYNNTAIFEAEGTPDVALPTTIDTALLNCLNATIGEAIPLEDDSAAFSNSPAPLAVFTIVGIIWAFM